MIVRLLLLITTLSTAAQAAPIEFTAADKPPAGWMAVAPPSTQEAWMSANFSTEEWRISSTGESVQVSPFKYGDTIVLSMPGGRFIGMNRGEFGGTLQWDDAGTNKTETILHTNPVAFVSNKSGIFAFAGLAHLVSDNGRILKLKRSHNGQWRARTVMELDTAPRAVFSVDDESVLVLTTASVLKVNLRTLEKTTLYENRYWSLLYGNSIVQFKGMILIGGRRAIIRLSPSGQTFAEEWWIPSTSVSAEPVKSQVLSSGICEEQKVEKASGQPQSTAGYAVPGSLTITKQAEVIPLRKGISFGATWRVPNLPKRVEITYVIEHPPIPGVDGKLVTTSEERVTHETVDGVLEVTDCYELTEDHDLVPGDWSISIVYGGSVLAKRTYKAVAE